MVQIKYLHYFKEMSYTIPYANVKIRKEHASPRLFGLIIDMRMEVSKRIIINEVGAFNEELFDEIVEKFHKPYSEIEITDDQ